MLYQNLGDFPILRSNILDLKPKNVDIVKKNIYNILREYKALN